MKTMAERIDEIMDECTFRVFTVFEKCTVVACQMPNGSVIVESFAFADHIDCDETVGVDACMKQIEDKIWELEVYASKDSVEKSDVEEQDDYDMCPFPNSDCSVCPHCHNCLCDDNYYDYYDYYDEYYGSQW